jgi:hypothetical protein
MPMQGFSINSILAAALGLILSSQCSKPFGSKPEIQHNKKRKRSVPTITREE